MLLERDIGSAVDADLRPQLHKIFRMANNEG
jgi:hypothetical protein